MGFDLGKIIGTVAPWIATAIGGPAVGAGVKAAAKALGLGDDATKEDVAEAMREATPDQLLALKKADQEFALKMQELGIKEVTDLERINADDRASARAREIAVKDKTPMILAFSIAIGFLAVLALMMFSVMPSSGHDALLVMLGYLGGAFTAVVSYYFGSNKDSSRKTEIIAKAQPVKDA